MKVVIIGIYQIILFNYTFKVQLGPSIIIVARFKCERFL